MKIDKYYHCVSCGKNMIVDREVDGHMVKILSGEHGEKMFLLNDNTFMTVCMCKHCQSQFKFTPESAVDIMQTVYNGWVNELNTVLKDRWSQEQKDAYLLRYGQLQIVKEV